MNKSLFLIALSILSFNVFSQNYQWAKNTANSSRCFSIDVDAAGNVYTIGDFSGTSDFDPSPSGTYNLTSSGTDVFILKVDGSGNFVWAKCIGGASDDYGMSISVDASGNVFTTGQYNGTADFDPSSSIYSLTAAGVNGSGFVLKLDAAGNFVWAKSISGSGTSQVMPSSIIFDTAGNILTTGYFYGNIDFDPSSSSYTVNTTGGAGSSDIYILKLDGAGNFLWVKTIGGNSGNSQGHSITVDVSNNIYTTGEFRGTADFNPNAPIYNLSSAGGSDIFISKLDATGSFIWAKKMGGVGQDFGNSIAIDATNNVYLNGSFTGTSDFDPSIGTYTITSVGGDQTFISKLDAAGNFVWAKNIGGVLGFMSANRSIALDAAANIYSIGSYSGTADFDPNTGVYPLTSSSFSNIFISKLTNAGNFSWAKSIGYSPSAGSIVCDAFDNAYISGYFNDSINFGANTIANLTAHDNSNVFIAKIGPCPSPAGNIQGVSSICAGNVNQSYSINIVSGATNYSWVVPSGVIINSGQNTNSINVTLGSNSGNIVVTPSNTCGISASNSVSISINPTITITAISSSTLLCSSESATLSVNGANTYTWSTLQNGNSIAISPTVNTTYTVNGTDINGCSGLTTITQNVGTCNGIQQLINGSNLLLNVFPNPNNGEFIIKSSPDLNLNLINQIGQIIQVIKLNSSNDHTINIEGLSSGIYFVTGQYNNQLINQKIIVAK